MNAQELVAVLRSGQLVGQPLVGEVSALVNDTRQLQPDCAFIAIKGERFDGHTAVAEVAAAKAKLMIVESLPSDWAQYALTYLVVPSTFRAQAILANQFLSQPTTHLNVIAVTGTNGKTTISTLISEFLMALEHKTGVIGTLHYKVDQTYYPSINTTPDALRLQGLFAEMVVAGCQDAIIEASSHALALGRLWYTDIDCAIFTNLTREHLDFHKTMEGYAHAKALLFAQLGQQFHQGKPRLAIVNADDSYHQQMIQATAADVLTYSLHDATATVYAYNLRLVSGKQVFDLQYKGMAYEVTLPMIGDYNVSNFLAVFLCLTQYYGVAPEQVIDIAQVSKGVSGRMEQVDEGQPFEIVVDFAHTPDAIQRVLSELAKRQPRRLVTIVGHSGGNRDSGARPEIGDYVFQYSDMIIFTADNPRFEPVEKICRELIQAHDEKPYVIIEDREAAIDYAIRTAEPGDLLVFAGKGSEPYQVIGDEKVPYDEVTLIKAALQRIQN